MMTDYFVCELVLLTSRFDFGSSAPDSLAGGEGLLSPSLESLPFLKCRKGLIFAEYTTLDALLLLADISVCVCIICPGE